MEAVEFGTYQLLWYYTQQSEGKQMSYKDEMDANDKKEAKTKEEITNKVWADAVADADGSPKPKRRKKQCQEKF